MKQTVRFQWRRSERWGTKEPGDEGEHIYEVWSLYPKNALGNQRAEILEDGSRWLFQAWHVFKHGPERIFIEHPFDELETAKKSGLMMFLMERE